MPLEGARTRSQAFMIAYNLALTKPLMKALIRFALEC
jgi:hypothetical protein